MRTKETKAGREDVAMGRWHLILKPTGLQDISLLDYGFLRSLFCFLGLFGGCIVQKKRFESVKALGILVFSEQKERLIFLPCLPLNTATVAVSCVLFRLMSPKLILCSINLHKCLFSRPNWTLRFN